ncbi:MAG: hypothetical protein CSA68_09140 [Rhodobacterales bacterium]|nr:MAG: hypothetical protein CSA68_09140 [Rhodobacterales bacterium]
MKAIAEYFRDLAADDRYFGAEPPTPDAEMLARIASRQIHQQVNAQIEDGGVTLRPSALENSTAPQDTAERLIEDAPAKATSPAPEIEIEAPEAETPEIDLTIEAPATDDTADVEPVETVAEESDDTESVAAKLRRIRAVVSKNRSSIPHSAAPQGTLPNAAFSEDQHADEFLPDVDETEIETDMDGLETLRDEALQSADIHEEFEAEADDSTDSAAMASIMNALHDDTPEPVAQEQDAPLAKEAAFDDDQDDEDDYAEEDDDLSDQENIFGAVQDILGHTELSSEEEADLVAELASVEMDDDSDLPEDDDLPEEYLDEDPAAEIGKTTNHNISRGINKMLRTERASRALRKESEAESEADVERLLDETNAKLNTDCSTRRRSVISHLRAAVAATIAERKEHPSDDEDQSDETQAYRRDLAEAVHRERSADDDTQEGDVSTPLILVSEQRIDRPEEHAAQPAAQPEPVADSAPEAAAETAPKPRRVAAKPGKITPRKPGMIRPRRIVASHPEPQPTEQAPVQQPAADSSDTMLASSTSFADFAAKMGATELPDILEAAAAYNAFIEGQPNFRRPQIMRRAASLTGKEQFNREEGLRSFGQLLRQGKIIKVERGRFEISENTRFKPSERFAGE